MKKIKYVICAALFAALLVMLAAPAFAAPGGATGAGATNADATYAGDEAAEWAAGAAAAEGAAAAGAYEDFGAILSGYTYASQAGGQDALSPNQSFLYRYHAEVQERREYEERKRQEEEEQRLAAEEERRLEEMRRRVASLTDAELSELYSFDYFVERMRILGYYRDEYSSTDLNYRNAVIRLQAATNMRTDAVLGPVSKKALLEESPVMAHDEVSTPASSGFWITINKSTNILTIYQGAEVYGKYPVATGRSPGLTPEGKYSFVTKSVNPAWGGGGYASPVAGGSPSNPLGKRWMGLSIGGGGRYGVHGNAAPNSIGTYASAGCVRMINADVEYIFEFIPVGTPVWIGTDSRLADFGIRQYYTIAEPPAYEAPPEPEPGPEADAAREEREAREAERAKPIILDEDLI
ncbi:MAG: L,D-transpeptidase [Oscillospiraceae bacterium]|nr:L,D-transpeptidase [Oscillospiraceae bacterium]